MHDQLLNPIREEAPPMYRLLLQARDIYIVLIKSKKAKKAKKANKLNHLHH